MAAFSRHIGIDYSGAETPESGLKDVRVYRAVGQSVADAVAEVFARVCEQGRCLTGIKRADSASVKYCPMSGGPAHSRDDLSRIEHRPLGYLL